MRRIILRATSVLMCVAFVIAGLIPAMAYAIPEGEDVAYEAAAESMVLLRNEKNALPLTSKDKVALFGEGQVYTDGKTGGFFLMGRGSGYFVPSKTPPSPCDLLSSYANKGKLGGVYSALCTKYKTAASAAPGTDFSYSPSEAECKAAAEYADKAIYFLNRTSKEGSDNAKTSFYLSAAERADLKRICAAFDGKPVIVVLNTGSVMSCGFALGREEGIYADALLTAAYPGISGIEAMCDILVGELCPSAKTVDTYAKKLEDYPSYESFYQNDYYSNYTEDIYVGYRYFETFNKDAVDYPFGYGLSYTEFTYSVDKYEEKDGRITVEATVKNVGERSGKQTLELYFSAPQRGEGTALLSKAARELCAYAKTKLLAPGESQKLKLEFDIDSMASYDDTGVTGKKSAYVLERGEYEIFVGSSVRDLTLAGTHAESALRITEQLSELCEPATAFERMIYGGTEKIGGRAVERKDLLHTPKQLEQNKRSEPLMFEAYAKGEITAEEFLSQMSDAELCTFAVMTLAASTNTKAWGGSAAVAEKYGIPTADTCDGPAGLRISTKGTGLPCATALACTWNVDVVSRLGDVIGREAVISEVDAWLAPAVNIHRFPLCGRNYEYYSEDPFISGMTASAIVSAVEAHGVACSVKHFVGNERERYRSTMTSNMSERALREIYLEPFRACVLAGVDCVMTSYNKLNGVETAENAELLRGILRGEWGFEGLVTTDWSNDSVLSREVIAGNNVRSSTDANKLSTSTLMAGLTSGVVSRSLLIENATWVIKFLKKMPDGVLMAEYEAKKIRADAVSVVEAEDYYHKHGYARPEINASGTLMAYTRSYSVEWVPYLTYRLNVEKAGYYVVSLCGANNASTLLSDAIRIFIDGKEAACAYNAESTGSWTSTATRELAKVYLPEGEVTFKVKCAPNRSCGNFDSFSFTPVEKAYKPISTAEELIRLMSSPYEWKYKYYLTDDIDLSGYGSQSPIGTYAVNFTGAFDGMGHSIRGVDISSAEERDLGLFGKVKGGVIRDLCVYGRVESTYPGAVVGGIVGTLDPGGAIVGCKSYAEVTYTADKAAKGVGGVAGFVYSGSTKTGSLIKNCENNGSVRSSSGGADACVGGIAGACQNNGAGAIEIRGCINRGYVNGDGAKTGGILGYVSQVAAGGGVFVFDCDNRANVVSSVGKAGGLAGYLVTKSTVDEQKAVLSGCINRADVTVADAEPDRTLLVGECDGVTLRGCYVGDPIEEDDALPDESTEPDAPTPDTQPIEAKDDAGLSGELVLVLFIAAIVAAGGVVIFLVLKTPKKKEPESDQNKK